MHARGRVGVRQRFICLCNQRLCSVHRQEKILMLLSNLLQASSRIKLYLLHIFSLTMTCYLIERHASFFCVFCSLVLCLHIHTFCVLVPRQKLESTITTLLLLSAITTVVVASKYPHNTFQCSQYNYVQFFLATPFSIDRALALSL